MKTMIQLASAVCLAVACLALPQASVQAQEYYGGFDAEGFTVTNSPVDFSRKRSRRAVIGDRFSPYPRYAYSRQGLQAGLTHQWNQSEASSRSWHGNYGYWRYDQPTALVVPPTAAYQMSYGWGVGNNRSFPIHHQFGRGTAGITGGGGGSQRTPLYPSHSDQIGVYSVRAPF